MDGDMTQASWVYAPPRADTMRLTGIVDMGGATTAGTLPFLPPTDTLDLGRYAGFFRQARQLPSLTPVQPVSVDAWRPVQASPSDAPESLGCYLAQSVSRRLMLVLEVDFASTMPYARMIDLIEDLHYWRGYQSGRHVGRSIELAGGRLANVIAATLGLRVRDLELSTPTLDHMLVALGTEQPPLDIDMSHRLVYRHDQATTVQSPTVTMPAELNRSSDNQGVVSPYMTVLRGIQPYVENACAVSAVAMSSARSDMRFLRQAAHDTLQHIREIGQAQDEGSGDRTRAALDEIEIELVYLELNLSSWIEAQLDWGVELPSLRQRAYHVALGEALGLEAEAERQSRFHARLRDAAKSHRALAESLERMADEMRRRWWSSAFSLLSVILLPATLVLGFLGANISEVDPTRSFTDQQYWWLYVGAALAVIAIFTGALVWARGRDRGRIALLESSLRDANGRLASIDRGVHGERSQGQGER